MHAFGRARRAKLRSLCLGSLAVLNNSNISIDRLRIKKVYLVIDFNLIPVGLRNYSVSRISEGLNVDLKRSQSLDAVCSAETE